MPKGVGETEGRERGRLSEHQFKAICKSIQVSVIWRHYQRLSYRLCSAKRGRRERLDSHFISIFTSIVLQNCSV